MPSPAEDFAMSLLQRAVIENASDIHLEPQEANFRLRLRTPSGMLVLPAPDKSLFAPLVRYFKLLAKLDIAVEALPQDGKFALPLGAGVVEFRLSALPTLYGPSLVLRVLDRERIPLQIDALGLPPQATEELQKALGLPFGLIVVAGRTGSGKTTTLYACLRRLAQDRSRKIVTVEDPVEYALAGVQQVSVGPQVSFAQALRAFLRHDPDVIFVGEVRDRDTARLAIQAALTGHLVLTSLHAASVQEVPARLKDLGVEEYLLASGLKFILAQELHVTPQNIRRPQAQAQWYAKAPPA